MMLLLSNLVNVGFRFWLHLSWSACVLQRGEGVRKISFCFLMNASIYKGRVILTWYYCFPANIFDLLSIRIANCCSNLILLFIFSKMMLQHPSQMSASEVSATAIVPCLSPAVSLGFEDFTNLTPLVKEELRFAIQNKRLSHRMSSTLDTVTVCDRPSEMPIYKAEVIH